MSGAAKVVEGITGQTKSLRKARGERDAGFAGALDSTQATFELGQAFTKMGQESLDALVGLIKDPSSITEMPGYEFRRDEGQRGIERGAAAKGKLFSGATMRELSKYNQDYASKERGVEIDRLARLAELGLSGGAKAAQQRADLQLGRGDAKASAREREVAQQIEHGNMIGQSITGSFGKFGGGGQQPAAKNKDQNSGQQMGGSGLMGPSNTSEGKAPVDWDTDGNVFQ